MRALFLSLFFLLSLYSCKKQNTSNQDGYVTISERLNYRYQDHQLIIQSGRFKNSINSNNIGFKKVILLNSSLLGYFTELHLEDKIVGVSSPEYIFDEKIRNAISDGTISNVGNEQKYDLEKIIALKPDAIFTNYIPSFENTYEILKKSNIEIIFLDEYLETEPLAKAKYLLLFGELFGVKDLAQEKLNFISHNYKTLREKAAKAKDKPVVLANEMYGNQWFLPGGKSSVAHFFKDAHADYILADNDATNAIPLSFEEVYKKAEQAKFWVNIGAYQNKNMMLNINPNYAKMNVFNSGKLYTFNNREHGAANSYFQEGNVRVDLVLQDFIIMFHPELLPNEKLYFYKQIN